jgi:hypothetical protein
MARGLPCVTTARSELGRRLVEKRLALGVKPGDPDSLADVLVSAAADRDRLRSIGEACRVHCRDNFGFEHTAAPLLQWCRAPRYAADHGQERVVSVGLLSEPKAMVRVLEAYLDELSLGQVLYRSVRWLARRLLRAGRRRATAKERPVEHDVDPLAGKSTTPADLSNPAVSD